jgi:hypothetical protein
MTVVHLVDGAIVLRKRRCGLIEQGIRERCSAMALSLAQVSKIASHSIMVQ